MTRFFWFMSLPSELKEFLCGRKVYAIFVLTVCCGMLLTGAAYSHVCASSVSDESKCDMQKGSCTKNIAGLEVMLDITPKPVKAMKELLFSVTMKGGHAADNLILDLAMPGMYMGGNKVVLKKSGDGRYVGKGIIPRCPSGRKLWSATIDIPQKGKAEFLFDVIY